VDDEAGGGALGEAGYEGLGCADVVGVRGVQDDVGLGGFGFEEGGVVEIAVDEADGGVLGRDEGAFGGVADEGGDLEVWVGVGNGVERVAAYVAGCAGARLWVRFGCVVVNWKWDGRIGGGDGRIEMTYMNSFVILGCLLGFWWNWSKTQSLN
jgi:hypothetical protein